MGLYKNLQSYIFLSTQVRGNICLIIRKCMTVVTKSPDGNIYVFTKGADSVLSSKVILNKELLDTTNDHLVQYAKKGLRTLMLVYKEISNEELTEFEEAYNV